MTDVLTDVLWTEKYRPTKLDELALSEDNRNILQSYLDAGEIPHLLLVGPSGSGKTTTARILYHALDCQFIVLNASAERGIDIVRNRIGEFVRVRSAFRFNIVFLDESDAMTADAQTALRNTMESFAEGARFILTANRLHRIIGPIQSRCQLISMTPPPLKERYRILTSVLQREGITAETSVALGYVERYPDLRLMLWAAQRAYLSKGAPLPPVSEGGPTDGAGVLELLLEKNWTGLRRLTTSDGFEPQEVLRALFYAVPDEHEKVGFLRHIIGKGIHESAFTPDPIILFLGVCAEAMEGL